MAKRELIDRKALIDNGLSKGFCEWYDEIKQAEVITEQEVVKPYLEKLRAEIEQKLEQEEFARSVFRHEEKDYTKAEQCTGSIMAYRDVLKMFDKYKAESEVNNGTDIN